MTEHGSRGLLLGVDTGGTYTDAVLLDAVDRSIVRSSKAVTTRADLSVGIDRAIDAVMDGVRPDSIVTVSVSTTLATNAVVEGHGSPVLVILVGFDQGMVIRSGIGLAFVDATVESVAGGHDHHGNVANALDSEHIGEILARHRGRVTAVAVASAFAVRNPEHEHEVRRIVESMTDLPVTISSELSEALDAPRRALTTVLNARLLSRISELLAAVRLSLARVGIGAPVLIAKGDGSLAVADSLVQRPIETVLSGPAASMVGAAVLSNVNDFVLSDIGGTTTDVGLVTDGQPVVAAEGASVGGWRTMVRAIDVRTTGLGGDSEVSTDDTGVTVGPRRVVPLALVGTQSPGVIDMLRHELANPPSREDAGRFALLPAGTPTNTGSDPSGTAGSDPSGTAGMTASERLIFAGDSGSDPSGTAGSDPSGTAGMTATERRVFERVGRAPTPLRIVAPGAVERRALDRLVARGAVQLAGCTPSDAAHVLGLQDNWDRETALAAIELYARYTGSTTENFARAVWSETVRRSAAAVLEVALSGSTDLDHRLVRAATDGTNRIGLVDVRLRPTVPIVAVGGPAEVFYGEVRDRLDAALIIPHRFEVANAVGAAAGMLIADATAEVHLDAPGLYRVVATGETIIAESATDALESCRRTAVDRALRSIADMASGLNIGEPETEVSIERHDDPNATGDDGLYFARAMATARVRPYVIDQSKGADH